MRKTFHRGNRQARAFPSPARRAICRRLRRWNAIVAALTALGLNTTRCGATDYYVYLLGPYGEWFFPEMWADAPQGNQLYSVPVTPEDNVFIDAQGSSRSTVYNWNQVEGEADVGALVVDNGGDLQVNRGTLSVNSATIGRDGVGAFGFNQRGEDPLSINIANDLSVGKNADSTGYMSTGSFYWWDTAQETLSVGGNFMLGEGGRGVFDQYYSGATIVAGDFIIRSGTGTNISSATIHHGTFTIGANESIGTDSGEGSETFTQSDGTHTIGGNLRISGSYILSGGILNVGNDSESLSARAISPRGITGSKSEYVTSGSFTQTAGVHNVKEDLFIGDGANGAATYTLTGGSLDTKFKEYIGMNRPGVFNQATTGNLSSTNKATAIFIGFNVAAGTGVYNLGGTSLASTGFLDVSNTTYAPGTNGVYVGWDASGTFNHALAQADIGSLYVGMNATGTGTYNLQGGRLNARREYVGVSGSGTFNHTAGVNNVYLGAPSGGLIEIDNRGSYNLSSTVPGFLSTVNTGSLVVGRSSGGTFVQQSGVVAVDRDLSIGVSGTTRSTYDLRGGQLGTTDTIVGDAGTAFFLHSGGIHGITNALTVGHTGTNIGTYELSGGALAADYESVGDAGQGVFNQSGGSNIVSYDLILAASSGGRGTYAFSGGELTAQNAYVLEGSTFRQSGGAATIRASLEIHSRPAPQSPAQYFLDNGALNTVTLISNGEFIQGSNGNPGGINRISGDLVVGQGGESGPLYSMNHGQLEAGNIYVGQGAVAGAAPPRFEQMAGATGVSGTLGINDDGTNPAAYVLLTGGSLRTAQTMDRSQFNHSHGSHETGLLTVNGYGATAVAAYDMLRQQASDDPSVTASSISVGNFGVFRQGGGHVTVDSLTIEDGGVYNIGGLNNGPFNIGGNLDGSQLIVRPGGQFNPDVGSRWHFEYIQSDAPINNLGDATMQFNGGNSAILAGTVVVNAGTVEWSNGNIEIQDGGGFTNSGLFTISADGSMQTGGTNPVGVFVNSGILRKSAGTGVSLIPSTIAFSNPGGTIDVQTGTIRLDNTLQVDAGSSLTKTGDGTFDTTGGLVVYGSVTHSAGTVSNAYAYIFGNYNQSGGVHQAGSNYTLLGNTLPAQAVYTLSGGELHAFILSLGYGGGAGQIVQSGGMVSLLNLSIAGGEWGGTGGTGDYQMQGGQLSGSGQLTMGTLGTATFDQSGGDVAYAGPVIVGRGAGSGQYSIGAGTLSASYLQVGDSGASGGFTQNGGATTVGELYVSTGGGTGTVTVTGGRLTVGAGGLGSVSNHGTISQTGGVVTFGDFSGSGSVTVANTGSLTANHVRQDSLTVSGTGLVTVRPTGCGDGPGQPGGTSVVKNLTMGRDANGTPTGKVDIANNHLVVDWSAPGRSNPVEDVNSMLRAAYNTGNWDGNGLTSSRLSGHWSSQSIGILDNSVAGTPYTTFGGQSVPTNSTLVRYTLAADTNLDGTVDFTDLVKVNQNYNQSGTFHWWEGDFTYDGHVDFNDMTKLYQNYNTTLTCPDGGANMTDGLGAQTNSAMTLTGVDNDQFTAEMAVLDDLRAKLAASEPEHLAEFDAFVAHWWGGDSLTVVGAASEQGAAFSAAAVPEPSGAIVGLVVVTGALGGRRRRRMKAGIRKWRSPATSMASQGIAGGAAVRPRAWSS